MKKLVLGILIIAVAGFLLYKYQARTQSRQFMGNFLSINGDSVFLEGKFVTSNGTPLPADTLVKVEVVVKPTTEFRRVSIHLPSAEDLKGTDGRFEVDKLKTEESMVTFEEFKKDTTGGVTLDVRTGGNILDKTKFEAEAVTYRKPVMPK